MYCSMAKKHQFWLDRIGKPSFKFGPHVNSSSNPKSQIGFSVCLTKLPDKQSIIQLMDLAKDIIISNFTSFQIEFLVFAIIFDFDFDFFL